jgi:tRNA A37 threonylcarbamoyladenosine synthetase subunit TsaC/SUA5/YrdC
MHPKKKTIGLRIPSNPIAQALLKELGEPLLTSTLILPDQKIH